VFNRSGQSSDPVGSDGATLDVANGPRYVTTDYAYNNLVCVHQEWSKQ